MGEEISDVWDYYIVRVPVRSAMWIMIMESGKIVCLLRYPVECCGIDAVDGVGEKAIIRQSNDLLLAVNIMFLKLPKKKQVEKYPVTNMCLIHLMMIFDPW